MLSRDTLFVASVSLRYHHCLIRLRNQECHDLADS